MVCAWGSIVISHLRFRKAKIRNGQEDQICYKMPLHPYGNYLALVFVAAVLVCIAILPETRISLIVSGVWVLVVFVAYTFYTRTQRQRSDRDCPAHEPNQPGESDPLRVTVPGV
ncbi:hypothetical protein ACFV2X_06395 [Streptomyces sp. NPDC059679]|uniref:hypothetical protein n=1 Tax=Streptomyces sp. NPDC059679 TaxID=3346903 RepID=UPI0036C25248